DASSRQRTLRNAIDWSWDLLADWERAAFAQCAVFRGGFTVDAAEQVVDLSAFPSRPQVVDVIQSLRDKSILRALPKQRNPRFDMYETLRDYGLERLKEMGDSAIDRHIAYFSTRVPKRIVDVPSKELTRINGDYDNLLVAHQRALGRAQINATSFANI